jgi:protein-disulfide isomerase
MGAVFRAQRDALRFGDPRAIRDPAMTKTRLLPTALWLFVLATPLTADADLPFQQATTAPPAPGVIAQFGDEMITNTELYQAAGVANAARLFELEDKAYQQQKEFLRSLVLHKFAARDPKRGKRPPIQFLQDEVFAGIKVTDDEVNAFIQARQLAGQNREKAQLQAQVRAYLYAEKRVQAADRWLQQKMGDQPLQLYLTPPERPFFSVNDQGAPVWGKPDAPVTVVEFSDFQCPFCARGSKTLNTLKKKYGDRLRLVFKQNPLPMHKHAARAAEASLCAQEQKEAYFWQLADQMFEHQNDLGTEALKKYAAAVGLDASRFEQCLSSNRMAKRVQQDLTEALELGIESTPVYFINGRLVSGAQPLEEFIEVIDQELKRP